MIFFTDFNFIEFNDENSINFILYKIIYNKKY